MLIKRGVVEGKSRAVAESFAQALKKDPKMAQAEINAEVARLIYDARTAAGLTQKQLADRIGTRQPVIARLEDADYEGQSLWMLQRIAKALNRRLEIRLAPAPRRLQRA